VAPGHGTGEVSELLDRVSDRLAALGVRLALAESCTGGMLAARFTDRPGASRFLAAGLVTYSDDMKTRLLGVDPGALAAHGAVSEPVARAMLDGALRACDADAALAITGIAGPGGGTAEKPVGTVWIGAALRGRFTVSPFRFSGDRAGIREASVGAAVAMLSHLLEDVEP
jgi:PncC family amidohydrolase